MLFGRHTDTVIDSTKGSIGQRKGDQIATRTWSHDKLGQESFSTHNKDIALGSNYRLKTRSGVSFERQTKQHKELDFTGTISQNSFPVSAVPTFGKTDLVYQHCTMGQTPFLSAAMASIAISETRSSQLLNKDQGSPICETFAEMVVIPSLIQGDSVSRTSQSHSDNRCKSARMGGSSGLSISSRDLVVDRETTEHKLVRTEGGQTSTSTLPQEGSAETCFNPHGQHGHEGPPKQAGRNKVQVSHDRDREIDGMGRKERTIDKSRTHFRFTKSTSRLAEQRNNRSGRMEVASTTFQSDCDQVWNPDSGLVCNREEQTTPKVLLKIPVSGCRRSRCAEGPLAEGTSLRISTYSYHSTCNQKNDGRKGGPHFDSSVLATSGVVCRPQGSIDRQTMEVATGQYFSKSRSSLSSKPGMAAIDLLALERIRLMKDHLPNDVIATIQAARRPATIRIYNATWRKFALWCLEHHTDPTSASIQDILRFLQLGLDKSLAPATLTRQVAALATVLSTDKSHPLTHDERIKSFLHGAVNLRPPVVHRFPNWDLNLVLQSLTSAPYEPIKESSVHHLTVKLAFLLAITSARRVSELAALSIRKDLCVFFPDRVVMKLDPTFIPKINSIFHRAQEIILPNFCPDPKHPMEKRWHTLDVRRALKYYLSRTAEFRKSEALLVSFLPSTMGQKVSSATIGRWIKLCISAAYKLKGSQVPGGIVPHSTRSAATSVAWAAQASIDEICRAATWSSISSFIRHYRLDTFASADAAFGRRVLQAIIPSRGQGMGAVPSQMT
ncbi:uncharacterized protein LOC117674930 [Pantherophis guttatus]|uniref:Uncharacterized protein LOC117674930 n=1 Tax=Pantherophis guttatus TaxID=94885 RepID=A0A6P9D037_PANGU|nr:uncharacterized protein LOC117674930 [Pantherophis guttatus]